MQGFQHNGFPAYFVYVAGIIELFGGILLILGLFTRIAALLIAGEMLIAAVKVHLPQGTVMQVKNYEFPMVLAAAAFVVATVGAGVISLDRAIYREGSRAPRKFKE
jgi:putative oxidoreductase